MIERTPVNFSRNLHLCALCVSALSFSDSLRPTSVVPTTYHFPSQRPLLNPFAINPLRTLFISTGWVPSSRPANLRTFCRSNWFPGYPLSFHTLAHSFAFFCTPQNQLFYFQAIPHSCKKTGEGAISAIRKFLRCSWKFSLVKVATLSAPRHASHESPVTKLGLGEPKST